MTNRVLNLLAVAMLAVFLFILVWKLKRVDLALLSAGTMALVLWDVFGFRRR